MLASSEKEGVRVEFGNFSLGGTTPTWRKPESSWDQKERVLEDQLCCKYWVESHQLRDELGPVVCVVIQKVYKSDENRTWAKN